MGLIFPDAPLGVLRAADYVREEVGVCGGAVEGVVWGGFGMGCDGVG